MGATLGVASVTQAAAPCASPVVLVTTTADSGPGSLRAALSAPCRTVRFVGAGNGNIFLTSTLNVPSRVDIDGTTAGYPGPAIFSRGLRLLNVSDVVIRGLRVRASAGDNITISGSVRVVIDRVSLVDAADGQVDINDSADVTISNSILAGWDKVSLQKPGVVRVGMYRNLLIGGQRLPQSRWDDVGGWAWDTTLDFRNNVVVTFGSGVNMWTGARGNIVANAFIAGNVDHALLVDPQSWTYVEGNQVLRGLGGGVNHKSTVFGPQPATPVSQLDVCSAFYQVFYNSGAPIRDGSDGAFLGFMVDYSAALPVNQPC